MCLRTRLLRLPIPATSQAAASRMGSAAAISRLEHKEARAFPGSDPCGVSAIRQCLEHQSNSTRARRAQEALRARGRDCWRRRIGRRASQGAKVARRLGGDLADATYEGVVYISLSLYERHRFMPRPAPTLLVTYARSTPSCPTAPSKPATAIGVKPLIALATPLEATPTPRQPP